MSDVMERECCAATASRVNLAVQRLIVERAREHRKAAGLSRSVEDNQRHNSAAEALDELWECIDARLHMERAP